jgi:hypothetical protein
VPPPLTLRDQPDDSDPRAALRASIQNHRRSPLSHVLSRRGLGPYRGYAEMLEAIERLAERGARVIRVGRSVRGEPLFAVHLGPENADARTRTSVVLSGVHPNEWIGIETHLALLDRLVGTDLGGRSLISFPIVNPDGVLKVEMNLRTNRRRFVRHNARGVDLNRNFDAHWHQRGLVQRLMSFVYSPGPRPESEPEVQAIAYELSQRRVDRALSLHSFGGVVLYPPASSRWPVPDALEHRTWAKRIARAADSKKPYRVTPASWWAFGITQSGLELDWFHDRHGALSLLIECSRGGISLRPSRLLQPFAWFNPPRIDDVTIPLVDAIAPFVRGLKP